MIDRFTGQRGKQLLIEELRRQKITSGISGLAEGIADVGEVTPVRKGQILIEQGANDTDLYLIIAGSFCVEVNKKRIARRFPGDHVGEMVVLSPIQARSATVVADEDAIVVKISESTLLDLADKHPGVWRNFARELSTRLKQRNSHVRQPNDKVRVFVISSAEALPIARTLQSAFAHDPFLTIIWSEGVFKVSNYTLQNLEDELDKADFAVAIASPDDQTTMRGQDWPTPRDNVVFELGFFMGRLGRQRAILMESRDTKTKLPSDLAGITTICYRFDPGPDGPAVLAPACHDLRQHILKLGPNV
jgi:CRP/FNR family cyclic AMP-dependent transcriptional regulator